MTMTNHQSFALQQKPLFCSSCFQIKCEILEIWKKGGGKEAIDLASSILLLHSLLDGNHSNRKTTHPKCKNEEEEIRCNHWLQFLGRQFHSKKVKCKAMKALTKALHQRQQSTEIFTLFYLSEIWIEPEFWSGFTAVMALQDSSPDWWGKFRQDCRATADDKYSKPLTLHAFCMSCIDF